MVVQQAAAGAAHHRDSAVGQPRHAALGAVQELAGGAERCGAHRGAAADGGATQYAKRCDAQEDNEKCCGIPYGR